MSFSTEEIESLLGLNVENIAEHIEASRLFEGKRTKTQSKKLLSECASIVSQKKPFNSISMDDEPEGEETVEFSVIVGNPPYQLNTGGGSAQGTPLYDKFVTLAKQLNPEYCCMIIPSRWYAGGMGLTQFRVSMLEDKRVRSLVDYPNAKDCFPQASIGGGVCYFLWDRDNPGKCNITNMLSGRISSETRDIDEFDVFVRYNDAVEIIKKVQAQTSSYFSDLCSSLSPFGIDSDKRGKAKPFENSVCLHSSDKNVGYIDRDEIKVGQEYIDAYKIQISKTGAEHAGEPDKNGKFRVLSTLSKLSRGEVCTFSYFIAGPFNSELEVANAIDYLETRFARFLVLQSMSSINLSQDKFRFVPMQDFSKSWTDEELYAKYNLNANEIECIENLIKPYAKAKAA